MFITADSVCADSSIIEFQKRCSIDIVRYLGISLHTAPVGTQSLKQQKTYLDSGTVGCHEDDVILIIGSLNLLIWDHKKEEASHSFNLDLRWVEINDYTMDPHMSANNSDQLTEAPCVMPHPPAVSHLLVKIHHRPTMKRVNIVYSACVSGLWVCNDGGRRPSSFSSPLCSLMRSTHNPWSKPSCEKKGRTTPCTQTCTFI